VTPAYQELSRFPAVTRDLALVVDQDAAAAILLKGLQAVAPAIVQRIELLINTRAKVSSRTGKALHSV